MTSANQILLGRIQTSLSFSLVLEGEGGFNPDRCGHTVSVPLDSGKKDVFAFTLRLRAAPTMSQRGAAIHGKRGGDRLSASI